MTFRILTNNPRVYERYSLPENQKKLSKLIYLEGKSYLEVLEAARDIIHEGHELLTHPLSGSVKPYETPYKSIALSEKTGDLNLQSLGIIEESIATAKKFINDHRPRQYAPRHFNDFMIIDQHLIDSGVESINQNS